MNRTFFKKKHERINAIKKHFHSYKQERNNGKLNLSLGAQKKNGKKLYKEL